MSAYQGTTLEDIQNASNRGKAIDVPVANRKRFLASKIHKLKKMLKLTSRMFSKHNAVSDISLEEWQNHQNSMVEQMQNYENHLLEKKFLAAKERALYDEAERQNAVNENWENWDSCYKCAGVAPEYQQVPNSICYVFMPGQSEPVPVKLRNARIPGGVMWIVYRPDVDICARDNLYSLTSSQIPQAQRPIYV